MFNARSQFLLNSARSTTKRGDNNKVKYRPQYKIDSSINEILPQMASYGTTQILDDLLGPLRYRLELNNNDANHWHPSSFSYAMIQRRKEENIMEMEIDVTIDHPAWYLYTKLYKSQVSYLPHNYVRDSKNWNPIFRITH